MSDKKIEKLRKLRNLSEDKSTTPSERELAYQKYVEYKKKYSLEDFEEEEKKFHYIRAKDFYSSNLLFYILVSFGLEPYSQKRCSQNKIIFFCTESVYLAVKDDYDFHSVNLHEIIYGITVKYLHTQIKPPEIESSGNSKYSKNFIKSYFNNEWLNRENYKNKVKIEKK